MKNRLAFLGGKLWSIVLPPPNFSKTVGFYHFKITSCLLSCLKVYWQTSFFIAFAILKIADHYQTRTTEL